jgi:hypothetical protein
MPTVSVRQNPSCSRSLVCLSRNIPTTACIQFVVEVKVTQLVRSYGLSSSAVRLMPMHVARVYNVSRKLRKVCEIDLVNPIQSPGVLDHWWIDLLYCSGGPRNPKCAFHLAHLGFSDPVAPVMQTPHPQYAAVHF